MLSAVSQLTGNCAPIWKKYCEKLVKLLRLYVNWKLQLNALGYPTVEGMVHLYTEGIDEKPYVLATVQAVHTCLNKVHIVVDQNEKNTERSDQAIDTSNKSHSKGIQLTTKLFRVPLSQPHINQLHWLLGYHKNKIRPLWWVMELFQWLGQHVKSPIKCSIASPIRYKNTADSHLETTKIWSSRGYCV